MNFAIEKGEKKVFRNLVSFIGTQPRGRKTYDSHQRLTSVRLFIYFIPLRERESHFSVPLPYDNRQTGGGREDGKRNVKFLRLGFCLDESRVRDIFRAKFFVRLFLSMLRLVFVRAWGNERRFYDWNGG